MSAEDGFDKHWATVQADDGGQPLIVRIRADLAKPELQARWPNRMVVLRRFPPEGPEGSRGLPSAALRAHPRYPLALHAAPDPAWRQWRGLLAALGLTPA